MSAMGRGRAKTPYRNDNQQSYCSMDDASEAFSLLRPCLRQEIARRWSAIAFSHGLGREGASEPGKRAIFTAASHAQKAADYLHGLQALTVAA
jgi:hypothetical protein